MLQKKNWLKMRGNRITDLVEILACIIKVTYNFEFFFAKEKFSQLLQWKNRQAWLKEELYKNYIRNTFQNVHFGNTIFFVYITRYHSPATQEFIKFERSYRAACLNSWVVIVRRLNFRKLQFDFNCLTMTISVRNM